MGWPILTLSGSPSGSGLRSFLAMRITARSRLRSDACTDGDIVPAAVGELHLNRPGLADDVIIRGDQPFADDEAGAQSRTFAVPGPRDDHDHGRLGPLGNLLNGGSAGRLLVLGRLGGCVIGKG